MYLFRVRSSSLHPGCCQVISHLFPELFLNEKSQDRKKKGKYEYRLRWDKVVYEPGESKGVAYKDGEVWNEEVVEMTGEHAEVKIAADRKVIDADRRDLFFVTVEVTDEEGLTVPAADNIIKFEAFPAPRSCCLQRKGVGYYSPYNREPREY